MTDVLEVDLSAGAFPGADQEFIVDAEVGMVSVVGKGRSESIKP